MNTNLEEESKRIAMELVELKTSLESEKAETRERINETTEYKKAAAQGDLRENAAFSEAIQKLAIYRQSIGLLDKQLYAILKVDERSYTPIKMVLLYSTVLLRVQDSKQLILKLYPKGVSDIDRRILSVESPLGKALWQKEVGEVVEQVHKLTGVVIHYQIIDTY